VERKVGVAYGAADGPDAGFPRRITYLIDENGVILDVLPKVDPSTHTDEVLAKLA